MKQLNVIPDKIVTTLFLINFPQAGYDESPVVLVDRWPRTKRAAASFQPVTRLHQTRVSGRHENSTKWLKRPFLLSVIWKRCLSTPEKETTILSQKLLLLMINLATIPLQLSKSNYSTFQGFTIIFSVVVVNVNYASKTKITAFQSQAWQQAKLELL